MTRSEFLKAAEGLCGPGRGTLARTARLLGLSYATVRAINLGTRPVPAEYAQAVKQALEATRRARGARGDTGGRVSACLPFVQQGLDGVLESATRAGWTEGEVAMAVAAWAAVRLHRAA